MMKNWDKSDMLKMFRTYPIQNCRIDKLIVVVIHSNKVGDIVGDFLGVFVCKSFLS